MSGFSANGWWKPHAGFPPVASSKRLGGLGRKSVGQGQETVLIGLAHVGQPLRRHAVGQQVVIGQARKQRRLGRHRLRSLHIRRDENLLNRFTDLDQLSRTRARMRFESPALRPVVGLVVMIDVAKQEAVPRSCARSVECRC